MPQQAREGAYVDALHDRSMIIRLAQGVTSRIKTLNRLTLSLRYLAEPTQNANRTPTFQVVIPPNS
jgi:hypothetical protein